MSARGDWKLLKMNFIRVGGGRGSARALTMVRFVGKGHLNDPVQFTSKILVRHLS